MDIPEIPEELRRKIRILAAEEDEPLEDNWLEEENYRPETVIIVLVVVNE